MKRMALAAALAAASACTLVGAGGAAAAATTVCAKGCAFTGIQAAINAASPGDTITVAAGKYYENVTVDRPLTLQGSGDGTVVYPATSAPNPCAGSSLCGGLASNIVLVQAGNVTISNMRLEGDNPNL